MKDSLYALTSEFEQLINGIAESGGEVSENTENRLATVAEMMVTKTDSIVGWVQSQEDLINLAKNRISELLEFISRIEKKLDNFDKYVNVCMEKSGKAKFEGRLSTITKRKPAQVVEIFDEALIDVEFIKIPEVKPVIQKAEIAKVLKDGGIVKGARLKDSDKISITYKIK